MTLLRTAVVYVTALQRILAHGSGCGASLPDGQDLGSTTNVSITSDELQRSYLIFIPESYNSSALTPLIFSYHGGQRNALYQLELDELTNPEFNTLSLVIYPEGIDETWQGTPGVTTNDTQFTLDILDEVESLYCIDTNRVSATGKSEGGGLVNLLACDAVASTRFASFAPVSGAYYVDTLPCEPETVELPCSSARDNIPMLTFHGGDDTTIPYLGGEQKDACLPAIPHFIQQWAMRNELGDNNRTTLIEAHTWSYIFNETDPGLVGLLYESNVGHDWPSTVPNADNTKAGQTVANYNATPIIVEFFQKYALSSSPTTTSTATPSSTTSTTATPSHKSDAISYMNSRSEYAFLISMLLAFLVPIAMMGF